jgi:hypothetical protein
MNSATGISVTGGSAHTFKKDALPVNNGVHIYDSSESDFKLRHHATLKARQPVLRSDGTYSKANRTFNYTIPFVNAAGEIEFATFSGETNIPSEALGGAVHLELRLQAVQMMMDADLDDYHNDSCLD